MAAAFPDESAASHYQLLEVGVHATDDDIRRAFRWKARQTHPDKNLGLPEAEELMKRLNKAYETLTDRIKRADYDEHLQSEDTSLQHDLQPLPEGLRLSEHFLRLLQRWKEEVSKLPEETSFERSLEEKLQSFQKGPFKNLLERHTVGNKQKLATSNGEQVKCRLDEVLNTISIGKPVASDWKDREMSTRAWSESKARYPQGSAEWLAAAVDRCRSSTCPRSLVVPDSEGTLPIIDVSVLFTADLQSLFRLFTVTDEGRTIDKLSRNEMLTRLNTEYVPRVAAERKTADTTKKAISDLCCGCSCSLGLGDKKPRRIAVKACSVCLGGLCSSCTLSLRRAPHMQSRWSSLVEVCSGCLEELNLSERNKWIEQFRTFLQRGDKRSIAAAFGCLSMAISSSTICISPISTLARELLGIGWPEMALQVVVPAVVSDDSSAKERAIGFNLIASALTMLAKLRDTALYDQQYLLLAAKEAYDTADSNLLKAGDSTMASTRNMKEKFQLDAELLKIVEDEQRRACPLITRVVENLERLWHERDWNGLLTTLTAPREEDHDSSFLQVNISLDALERFLATKEVHLGRLSVDDRVGVIFLRGILKVSRDHLIEGLIDIEQAVWSGCHLQWLPKVAVDVVVNLLSNSAGYLHQRLCNIGTVLKDLRSADFLFAVASEAMIPLLPTVGQLAPPSTCHWPDFTVSGINTKATRKYEESIRRQVSEGKLSERNAALAYIDFCPSSNHPAEAAVSFVIAGLWFLKDLQCKAAKYKTRLHGAYSKGSDSGAVKRDGKDKSQGSADADAATSELRDVFAVEQAVLECMRQAYLISSTSLHPGMQLYILRLALKATLTAVQLVNERATPEDCTLVVEMLHSLLYACRMIPFWQFPVVTVSEAVLLNIISGRVHSHFLLSLQHIQVDERSPISNAELKYQLYENDLRLVWPIDDHSLDPRICAMEAMLQEKGWSWQDVTQLMTSPLSQRCQEGWLIQQPRLGVSMPYAELKGFAIRIEAASSSVRLLVKKADVRSTGLLGPDDVAEVLELEKPGCTVFSLEQPSRKERFHPFQEYIYGPDGLEGTKFLHTMFETDYLLKSFSVGVEVSSNPPFKQRPIRDGLIEKLPAKLRYVLRPLSERGFLQTKSHRFWIQADELVYSTVSSTGSRVEYHLGEPKMVIRSHRLLPGLDGKLHDTEDGEDPNSPEAQFAADLTAHYDEIGLYFPMFARLKELVKLQFFAAVIRSNLDSLKSKADGKISLGDDMLQEIRETARRRQRASVETMLKDLKRNFGVWPAASNYSEVSAAVQKSRDFLRSSAIPYDFNLESEVKRILAQRDQQVLSAAVDSLMQQFKPGVSRGDMEKYVSTWLSGSVFSQLDLASLISSSLPLPLPNHSKIKQEMIQHFKAAYWSFASEVSYMKHSTVYHRQTKVSSCKWVPAALLKQKVNDQAHSVCYGGVLLAPQVREGTIPRKRRPEGKISFVRVELVSKSTAKGVGTRDSNKGPTFSGSTGSSSMGGSGGGSDDDGKPKHQWNHVFQVKLGHVKPKQPTSLSRWMKLFLKVRETGRRSHSTFTGKLDERAVKAGDLYYVKDYNRGQAWAQVTKDDVIRSAGVNRLSDPRITQITMLRYLNEFLKQTVTEVFQRAEKSGIDPGRVRLGDAVKLVREEDDSE